MGDEAGVRELAVYVVRGDEAEDECRGVYGGDCGVGADRGGSVAVSRRVTNPPRDDIPPYICCISRGGGGDLRPALERDAKGTAAARYRMYWGKKIIEWSKTYEDALDLMIRLHDVYALDGRDPNTARPAVGDEAGVREFAIYVV